MKVFFVALIFFLVAFTGLAAGLLLKRKGLRGGCTPPPGDGSDCQCKSGTTPGKRSQCDLPGEEKENHPA